MKLVTLSGVGRNCSFFYHHRDEMSITIQSHSRLIISVMIWINYQLNPRSHKSVAALLCAMGRHPPLRKVCTRHKDMHMHVCLIFRDVFQQME